MRVFAVVMTPPKFFFLYKLAGGGNISQLKSDDVTSQTYHYGYI